MPQHNPAAPTHTQEQWRIDYDDKRNAKTFVYAAFEDGVGNRFTAQLEAVSSEVSRAELEQNAKLMAAAGNAATTCLKKGFHPLHATKALPKLIEDLEELLGFLSNYPHPLGVDISEYINSAETTLASLRLPESNTADNSAALPAAKTPRNRGRAR